MTPDPSSSLDVQRVRTEAERCYAAFLDDLRTLVNIDCGTYLPAGVDEVADHMKARFAEDGWSVERHSHSPEVGAARLGDLLIATLAGRRPAERGGRRVLLVGHMDTVFPEGTVADRPFRVEGERAFGPGVSDMKGGLLAGLYASRCLLRAGFNDFDSITYVCNPDEEIGSPFSGPHILDRAREADVCFVLEGARENGDIVSSRKGVADLRLVVHGRAAHAGVEPERGRSAALQAAHTTISLSGLSGTAPGVTVNVGVIHGGTRPNVVTERCELQVDVRGPTARSFEGALEAVRAVAASTVVPDTTIDVTPMSGFPPMEKTEAAAALVEKAQGIAAALGFDLKDAATGGASDANPIAGLGVPTLDGLGPIGGADHSPDEWLDLSSVVPRMAMLAALIASRP